MTHPFRERLKGPRLVERVTLVGMEPKLSLTDRAVRAALGEGAAHGFKLAALFAKDGELGTVWTVQRPQVYRALEHLELRGLAYTTGHEPGAGGPPRLEYILTERGRTTLDAWLATPVTHLRDARSELLLKLAFLERLEGDAGPLLRAQTRHFKTLQHDYRARLANARGATRLALSWRLEALAAALRFLADRS